MRVVVLLLGALAAGRAVAADQKVGVNDDDKDVNMVAPVSTALGVLGFVGLMGLAGHAGWKARKWFDPPMNPAQRERPKRITRNLLDIYNALPEEDRDQVDAACSRLVSLNVLPWMPRRWLCVPNESPCADVFVFSSLVKRVKESENKTDRDSPPSSI